MKIGLVLPGFSASERDWCIPALLDFVRVLAERAEVHVFTLRYPEHAGRYQVYGASVHALNEGRRLGARVVGFWSRAAAAIRAEHDQGRFDVLHAFWADEPGWVAAWAGRRLGVPVVISLAGGELVRLPVIGYGLTLLPGRRMLLRLALRQAAAVTAGSAYLCGLAAQAGFAGRVEFAPLGVDTCLFRPPASPASAPVVLNVGSLVAVKDQARLVRLFRDVAAKVPEAELIIAGEGPLRAALESQARGLRVRFAGAVDHAEMAALYGSAAVLVQTSRHEAQGLAVLEAGACAVPAVGTRVGVLPEVGQAADTDAVLVDGITTILRDLAARQAAGRRAYERVMETFRLEAALERFWQIYLRVGGAAGSAS
jgi:glycosyltransferase involved in cell wall biosynthesis